MPTFESLLYSRLHNKEKIEETILESIEKISQQKQTIDKSIFGKYPAQVKLLLQSDEKLFWKVWEALNQYRKHISQPANPTLLTLQEKGIVILEDYFNAEQIELLKNQWQIDMSSMPPMTEERMQSCLKNRFHFEKIDEIGYALGSPFDGKKRALHYSSKQLPNEVNELLFEHNFFNELARDYYGLLRPLAPSVSMFEELNAPQVMREDQAWHIDNLTDQLKIMIYLDDMQPESGPFTYVEETHTVIPRYHERYHKMYAMNGMTTQEHNHFENSFVELDKAKKAVLKAGSIVIFDCMLHHTATFPKSSCTRKNIVLYFTGVPTLKNKCLTRIDQYLNFGLR